MTDLTPAEARRAAWAAMPALAAQSNILGPYILILTAMVGVEIGVPKEMCWQLFGAGLMAWKAGTI
jgi:hypothetical protein